jgi:hypothetical protein
VIFVPIGNFGQSVTSPAVRPLLANGGVVESYVALGGVLFVHGAHNDVNDAQGPGGSMFRSYLVSAVTDNQANIVDGDHEFVTGAFAGGVPLTNGDFLNWNSTCHGAVDPPPGWNSSGGVNLGTSPQADEWNEILFSPLNMNSAMLEYTFGCGYVIMDMMTFDWDGFAARDAVVAESAAYVQGIQVNFPFCNLDSDEDGINSDVDNCPTVPNPLQEDTDGDGRGDACDFCDETVEPDTDGDGICDSVDACPGDDFLDTDTDGVADGCDLCPVDPLPDEDTDGDSVCNVDDVCPNGDDLLDSDGDSFADGCDRCQGFDDIADFDLDAAPDGCDNCPHDENELQLDDDGDGEGNKCDCGSDDPNVNSQAVELCDDIDNDCDGEIDEPGSIGPKSWFADLDGDGQGDGDVVVNGCEKPDAAVVNADDCDDANPLVFLGADEFCDGRDTNCDGDLDDPGVCPEPAAAPPGASPSACGDCSSAGRGAAPWLGLAVAGLIAARLRR